MQLYFKFFIYLMIFLFFFVFQGAGAFAMTKNQDNAAVLMANNSKPRLFLVTPKTTVIKLQLPANQTTGYSWSLIKYDSSRIQLLSSHYVSPKTNMMGSPGYAEFVIKILPIAFKPSQKLQLTFVYKRPWEKENGQVKVITLITKASLGERR